MTLGVALGMKVIRAMNHSSNPRTLLGTYHFPSFHQQMPRIRVSGVDIW
jgi:hypothetical protein